MKFKYLFIANLSEVALSLIKEMKKNEKDNELFEDHAYCDRFLLSDKDDRILVTPLPIDNDFFSDIKKIFHYKNVFFINPKKTKESICQAIIEDKKTFQLLIEIIKKNPKIRISAYVVTEEFLQLIEKLKSQNLDFYVEDIPEKDSLWTTSYFDSKAGFRQALNNLSLPSLKMSTGYICQSKKEVINWAKYFINNKKSFVIKANYGLAGAGLQIINKGTSLANLESTIDKIFQQELFFKKDLVVVEQYIEPDINIAGGAPSVEMRIIDDKVKYLYSCGMRVSPKGVFLGIELGKNSLPKKIEKELLTAGKIFGNFLLKMNYKGFFDIDFVYGKDNRNYALEANLRRTGGTHIYEAAKRLLGKDFIKKYYLVSSSKKSVNKVRGYSYKRLREKISDLIFPIKNKKEGVIISTYNYLVKGFLGYLIIGKDKKRAYQIENEFLKRVDGEDNF